MEGSVRKKGTTWYYRYYIYIDGKKKQIERKGGKTKKEALEKLNEELYREQNGIERPKETLLSNYLDMWLEEFVKIENSENTYTRYKGTVNKYIKPNLGNLRLCDIKVIHLHRFLNNLKNTTISNSYKKLSNTTVQKHFMVLNTALNKAVKLQMINDNPCKYIDVPKRDKFKANILTLEEFNKIFSSLDIKKYDDHLMQLAMSLTLELGLRRGEMCGLQWNDIDFNNKTLSVKQALIRVYNEYKIANLKTESSYRTIPLSDNLIKILKEHKNIQNKNKLHYGELYCSTNKFNGINYDLIFTNELGSYVIPSRFLQRLKRLCKYNEIDKNIRWHDLRHTNATVLLQTGVSMKVIQERLGHSLMQTTSDIYAHVTENLNREATNVLSTELYKNIL